MSLPRRLAIGFFLPLLAAALIRAEEPRGKDIFSCKVVLKSTFSSTPGTLHILPNKILFEALERSESREWPYDAVRYLEWKGPGKVELKSREHDVKVFGKQKTYTFLVEEPPFDEKTAEWVNDRIGRAAASAASPSAATGPDIAWPVVRQVEHQHSFGSCNGSLVISPEAIDYKPRDSDHAFHLSYMDIREASRRSPFHLKLVTYKKSAKKMWFSEDLEFTIQGEGLPDNVFQYIIGKIRQNNPEEK